MAGTWRRYLACFCGLEGRPRRRASRFVSCSAMRRVSTVIGCTNSNRIKGLLHGQGIRDARPLKPSFLSDLDKLRTGDGRALPPRLRDEIRREHERLLLVCKQIKTLEAENIAAHSTPAKGSVEAKAVQLAQPASHWTADRPGSGQRGVLSRLQ